MGALRRFEDLLRDRNRIVLALAVAVTALPLVVAAAVLIAPAWHPVGDLAQAAMRQESFWRHPPLVGTAGRIGTLEQQGNHPGPALFWVAWPVWKLLGSSPWALQVSSIVVAIASVAAAVAIAARTFGGRVGLAVAAAGAVLVRAFGPELLSQPWNPYAPLLPFFCFVVACWTTASGRFRHLPVAVVAGSYCVQCHVGYAPAAVLGVVVAVIGLLVATRADPAPRTGERSIPARTAMMWIGAAAAVGVVVWLPPIIQELTGDPGNLSIILETYGDGDRAIIGARQGAEVLLTQLDPLGNVARADDRVTGAPLGGAVLLVAWAGAVVMTFRRRHRRLLALHGVLASQLLAMAIWSVRLDSIRFPYLVQWFWVVTVLLVLATGWALATELRGRERTSTHPWVRPAALAAAGIVVVGAAVSTTAAATRVERPFPNLSDTVAAVDDPTAAALDPAHRYLVEWRDGDSLGAVGFGLLLELERRGFDVGAGPAFRAAVEPHRVLDAGEQDGVITVVSGDDAVAAVRAQVAGDDQIRVVADVDARTSADRDRADRLRADAEARLRAHGRTDLADAMATSIWTPLVDPSIDDRTYEELWELVSMGQPTIVLLSPDPLPPA